MRADEHARTVTARGARSLWGVARKFFVRTFGCQMNEHDSERIAAELVADGLERTDDLEEADVVVLNTCCIRENADTKLYGHLGQLKSLAERKPGPPDRGRGLSRAKGAGGDPRPGARTSRRSSARTTSGGLASSSTRPGASATR